MKIIITGSTGFLGLHLCEYLHKEGHEVWGIGRNTQKGKLLSQMGCHFIQASIEEVEKNAAMAPALEKADIIIHSAALSSPWGKKTEFTKTNILGTKNILELATKYKIKKFIHISTPSLYFSFKDEMNISESKVLSPPFASLYTASKYEAEKLVDQAHKENNLFTITIRPRGIFGPGDESLLPRLIKVAGSKGLPIIGDGKNIIDLTYVENVVHAINKAIIAPAICNGQKYNITNGEPIELWPFLNNLLKELDIKISTKKFPFRLAYFYAFCLEIIHTYFLKKSEPKLTRYTVGLLGKSQTLSIEKARRELGYEPIVSMDQATTNVLTWWKKHES
jgi:nucleoside-diphosphate-sugar epimerase